MKPPDHFCAGPELHLPYTPQSCDWHLSLLGLRRSETLPPKWEGGGKDYAGFHLSGADTFAKDAR